MPSLPNALFDIGPAIRYVATYRAGDLALHERPGLSGSSDSESDRYEELLVNPTLLHLASQRGNIDCGGLDYLLIRYGNFFQFVMAAPDGHVSVALEPTIHLDTVRRVQAVVQESIRA